MNISRKTITLTAVCALTAAIAFGASSVKAETAGTNITATVQNAFTFVETQALSFGTIIAINDVTAASDTSTLVVDVAGVSTFNNPGLARLVEVTAAAQGIFDITGAAPTTALVLTNPAAVTLVCASCSGAQADFTADTFSNDVASAPTTDALGAVQFNFGGTLTTIPTGLAGEVYEDGAYTGAYTVTVNY